MIPVQVVGKGIDAYVLRVTVDIARRFWTVYRYDVPTFPGQLPDKTATQKLAAERIEAAENSPEVETFQTPLMYKKACIVVSWSRYMAVSVLYGPPSPRMIQNYKDTLAEIEREEEKKSLQRSRARTQSSEISGSSDHTGKSSGEPKSELEDGGESESGDAAQSPQLQSTAQKETENPDSSGGITPERLFSEENPYLVEEEKQPLRKTIRTWIKKKSLKIREQYFDTDKRKNLVDPSEGIMHLEKPLLLCQEIYTRIIGNHQTSLVSKEQVLELLQQDNAQHAAQHKEETDDSYCPIMTTDDNDESEGVEVDVAGTALFDAEHLYTMDATSEEATGSATGEQAQLENAPSPRRSASGEEEVPTSPISGVSEHKESILEDDLGEDVIRVLENDLEEEIIRVPEEDQPLVGYWLWENTLRTHKVKMHVAKGTDLALHVVLAIITNQVRYERNAIAMTI